MNERSDIETGEAQYKLAVAYDDVGGGGVVPDRKLAGALYKKSANLGHMMAQYHLGRMYCEETDPQDFDLDYEKGLKWILKAAEQGCVYAPEELCDLYEFREGVTANKVQAYKWLKIAENIANLPEYILDLGPKFILDSGEVDTVTIAHLKKTMSPKEIEEAEAQVTDWFENRMRIEPFLPNYENLETPGKNNDPNEVGNEEETAISEQFGETFNQLYEAVGRLVDWQGECRQQMSELKISLDNAVDGINEVQKTIREIEVSVSNLSNQSTESMSPNDERLETPGRRNDSTEVGNEGEVTVKQLLEDRGFEVEMLPTNYPTYDLIARKNGKAINVSVKTCRNENRHLRIGRTNALESLENKDVMICLLPEERGVEINLGGRKYELWIVPGGVARDEGIAVHEHYHRETPPGDPARNHTVMLKDKIDRPNGRSIAGATFHRWSEEYKDNWIHLENIVGGVL